MTEEEIQVLILMNEDVWDSYIPYLSAQVQQQLALGSFTGLTAQEVVANITASALSPTQVQTLVTTSLNNYSRSITASIMEEEPDDTLYWYIGPVDGRTRDICMRYVSIGKITQKEIQKLDNGQYSLTYGGGYNCRHKWEVAGKKSEFYKPKQATKFRKDKGLPDATVITKKED